MAWIPGEEELSEIILPSDARYYSPVDLISREGPRRVVREALLLLQSDILRIALKEMPPRLPKKLPRVLVETMSPKDMSSERKAWWLNYLNERLKWCHHDPELGYLFAKLLTVKFRKRLHRGWKVVPEPPYSGYRADIGLVNPEGACVIAVEIGDINPLKLVEPFHNNKLKQLWHRPYYGWPEERRYDWQREEVYFVWTRGSKWGEIPLESDLNE